MVRITKTKIADAIFQLRFRTQHELASTFLRFQEHFESVRFSGRIFTLEEFMDWYADAFGAFTYYQDWSGFNIPSTALEPFFAGRFDPLLEKERRLLDLFAHERRPFYVIGLANTSTPSDLIHELGHALFFTDPGYRRAVRAAMKRHDTGPVKKVLHRWGYARRVLDDEAHAYLLTPTRPPAGTRRLAPLRRELRAIFREHATRLARSWGGPWRSVTRPPRKPARRKD